MQRTLPVHQQHTAFTRFADGLGHSRVVRMARYRRDGTREALPGAKRTKLKAQMLGRWMRVR